MSKYNSKKSKLVNIFLFIIFLLLFLALLAFIVRYFVKNGDFTVLYKSYVYDVTDSTYSLELQDNDNSYFIVTGTDDYTVSVKPFITSDTDITYIVNGQTYQYSSIDDLTSYFDIAKHNDYFTLDCSKDYSLVNILSTYYGSPVTLLENASKYPYELVVTSSNGKAIRMAFYQKGISLNRVNIVF